MSFVLDILTVGPFGGFTLPFVMPAFLYSSITTPEVHSTDNPADQCI